MRTQVAIVGAGPSGMLLAHLLAQAGVEAVVLERHSRAYVEGRVRAGILEQGTVELLRRLGLADRLAAEGLVHGGFQLMRDGARLRIDMAGLTGGRTVTVYGQQEVMKDLFDAAEARGLTIIFEAQDVCPTGLDLDRPSVEWRDGAGSHRLDCDFVVGCDGQHGVTHTCAPDGALTTFERSYPFGWLGVLADVPPAAEELIYCSHERGFVLASMRSPTRSRYYLQCDRETAIADWPDGRFWDEVQLRLGPEAGAGVTRGAAFEKGIALLRSSVTEPMRYGRLFLAGDAAHTVPPTGAKGMNLAASDVTVLAEALEGFYARGSSQGLETYSARALARVWKAQRFSWWFTSLMHRFPDASPFDARLQAAEFAYIAGSKAAQTVLAENYAGLPI